MALSCQPCCLPSGDTCWLGDRVSSASSFSATPPSPPVPTCMLLVSHLPPGELLHTHLTFPLDAHGSSVFPALTALLHIQLPSWRLPGGLQAPHGPHSQNPVSTPRTWTTASCVPASVNGMHTRWWPGQRPWCLHMLQSSRSVHHHGLSTPHATCVPGRPTSQQPQSSLLHHCILSSQDSQRGLSPNTAHPAAPPSPRVHSMLLPLRSIKPRPSLSGC